MSKWKLLRLFNPLCYAGNVTSIEDLGSRVNTNLEDLRRKIPGWTISSAFNDDVKTIEKMIEDSKTVKFEDLPLLLVSKLHIMVKLRTVPTFILCILRYSGFLWVVPTNTGMFCPRGGGVLPSLSYIGMYRCEGYGFQRVY